MTQTNQYYEQQLTKYYLQKLHNPLS